MPFHIQYDKDTGQIMATVEGNFTPVIKDDRAQIVFDKNVDTDAKMIDLAIAADVVEEGKVLEASKDQIILKEDPVFDVISAEDPI